MKIFEVYIDKCYFPKELHPKSSKFSSVYELWHVKAKDRKDAAEKIWSRHGNKLKELMLSHVKRVSLNVGHKSKTGMNAGRQNPVSLGDIK